MRRALGAAAALLVAVVLTGCTEQGPGAGQGDGGVTEYQHPTTPVVDFSGPLLSGGSFSSSAHEGEVMVVNFWYAACGPCNAEAPTLEKLAQQYAGKAQFVGVNVRDSADTAKPFVQAHDVSYPSIIDQGTNRGAAQLAFAASTPITVTPITVVIGKQGRVTAVVTSEIDDPSILSTLIEAAVTGRDA